MTTQTSTALSAQGTGIQIDTGTTGTPLLVDITNVSDISGFDGKATQIDVTNLKSTAKERRVGLQDWGSVTLATDINLKEASHAALLAAKQAGTAKSFTVTLSDTSKIAFTAFVSTFPISAKVDAVYKGNIVLDITGDITVTPAA
jgi:predicted secreted protein